MSEETKKKLNSFRKELASYADHDPAAQDFSDSLSYLLESYETEPKVKNRNQWQELRSEIDQYQAEHPEFVALLNRIATTLSDMGI